MIAIIQHNAGNIRSVINALGRLGAEYVLTDEPEKIRKADKVIFPGVGEASSAMSYLRERKLDELIPLLKQPFLGICLGLQLMCSHSEEGDTKGLGIFSEKVKRFPPDDKVPHMGWNNFTAIKGDLLNGLSSDDDVYFVHSYYAECGNDTVGTTQYIVPFSSALHKDNFHAVQFHPEKSAGAGEQILKNFLSL